MEQQRDGGKAGTWTPAGVGSTISMCVSMCECLHMTRVVRVWITVCVHVLVSVYTVHVHVWGWGRSACLWMSHCACASEAQCTRQCLLVLSVLAWRHLSATVLLVGLTWLQRDKARTLRWSTRRWATRSVTFHTEIKFWTGKSLTGIVKHRKCNINKWNFDQQQLHQSDNNKTLWRLIHKFSPILHILAYCTYHTHS